MRHRNWLIAAACVVVPQFFPAVLTAAPMQLVASETSKQAPMPRKSWRAANYPQDWVAALEFQELPLERILEVQARNQRRVMKPIQIGVARLAASEGVKPSLPTLRWVSLKEGGAVARIQVRSPDAMALRVGLVLDAIHPAVELRFAGSSDPSRVTAVVRGEDALRLTDVRRVYWTPATDGESQIIEIFAPAGIPLKAIRLQVEELSHLLADSRNSFQIMKIGESSECNVDTACRVGELGQGFAAAKNAVAHMVFVQSGGTYICTGTLLNDADSSTQIPYFYSANHCISEQAVANTLNTHWNYEATSCGSGVSASVTQLVGGSQILYNDPVTDALLLRLNDMAPAGATFSGWDANTLASSVAVTAIHHPRGDSKKVSTGQSLGNDASKITAGWLNGTTEGGSSGSGLFRSDANGYYLVGGLYGGSASCANSGNLSDTGNRDYYSRFDVVFPNIQAYLQGGSSNLPPAASFTYSATGLTVSFRDTSSDPDGSIASRRWSFGDGASSSSANPSRTYAASGSYNVELTVTDDKGAARTTIQEIYVDADPGTALANGRSLTGLSANVGGELRYTLAVPAGARNLAIRTQGANGDADLYVKFASPPTNQTNDCASIGLDSNESCAFAQPQAGTYHVLVSAYQSFTGLTLVASYEGGVALPTLSIVDARVVEGDAGTRLMAFAVRLSAASPSVVSFDASTSSGTALAGSDYQTFGATGLTINPGQTSTTFVVSVQGDRSPEPDEYFHAAIANASGATLAREAAIGTIMDDDMPRGVHDFNGDRISDVLWRNSATGANTIWRSANSGSQIRVTNIANLDWEMVGVGDFDGDRKADIFWRNRTTGANVIWPSGSYAAQRGAVRISDAAWRVAGVADFDGDGEADLLWRNARTGANTIWRSASYATQQQVTRVANLEWEIVGVVDFNDDGKADILWRNRSTGANVIWRSGNSATRQAISGVSRLSWKVVGVGDFDGDGRGDILWRNDASGANVIWKSGNSSTAQRLVTITDLRWQVVGVGDYDADGRSDVLWRHATSGRNTIWMAADYYTPRGVTNVSNLSWKVMP